MLNCGPGSSGWKTCVHFQLNWSLTKILEARTKSVFFKFLKPLLLDKDRNCKIKCFITKFPSRQNGKQKKIIFDFFPNVELFGCV